MHIFNQTITSVNDCSSGLAVQELEEPVKTSNNNGLSLSEDILYTHLLNNNGLIENSYFYLNNSIDIKKIIFFPDKKRSSVRIQDPLQVVDRATSPELKSDTSIENEENEEPALEIDTNKRKRHGDSSD